MPKDVPIVHIDTVPADLAASHTLACDVVGDIRHVARAPGRASRPPATDWDLAALPAHRRRLAERAHAAPASAFCAAPRRRRDARTARVGRHPRGGRRRAHPPGRPAVGYRAARATCWSRTAGRRWDSASRRRLRRSWCGPTGRSSACTGDGGYLMMVGEINTAVQAAPAGRLRRAAGPLPEPDPREADAAPFRVVGRAALRRQLPPERHAVRRAGGRRGDRGRRSARRSRSALTSAGPVVIEAVVDPAEYDEIL